MPAHGVRCHRQQAPAPLRAGGHALGCQALLRASPGGDRRAAGRQNEAPARAGAATALGCLCGARGGTPTARAARARPAGTPADPRCPWPDRAGGNARAARLAPADRGVHDRGQCRRGRDAGASTRRRWSIRVHEPAVAGEGPGARAIFSSRSASTCRRARCMQAAALQPDPRARWPAPTTQHLVNEVVLRTQARPIYGPDNLGHFGLNLRRYAHFTSPIRRYADLIVHRALISALGLGRGRPAAAGHRARSARRPT